MRPEDPVSCRARPPTRLVGGHTCGQVDRGRLGHTRPPLVEQIEKDSEGPPLRRPPLVELFVRGTGGRAPPSANPRHTASCPRRSDQLVRPCSHVYVLFGATRFGNFARLLPRL